MKEPPYLIRSNGDVTGLTGGVATAVFKSAELRYQWKKTPSKRQMSLIKKNKACDCLVGWFKNPEREKFAKYTDSIYQDRPQIAITRADNDNLQSGMSISEVLSDKDLVLLVKDGYSYGRFIDKQIQRYKPRINSTTFENITMLKLVYGKRVDYFFLSPEEAEGLIKWSELPKNDLKFVHFSDMPKGEKRYILCSQMVGDDIINKLNSAIQSYHQ